MGETQPDSLQNNTVQAIWEKIGREEAAVIRFHSNPKAFRKNISGNKWYQYSSAPLNVAFFAWWCPRMILWTLVFQEFFETSHVFTASRLIFHLLLLSCDDAVTGDAGVRRCSYESTYRCSSERLWRTYSRLSLEQFRISQSLASAAAAGKKTFQPKSHDQQII